MPFVRRLRTLVPASLVWVFLAPGTPGILAGQQASAQVSQNLSDSPIDEARRIVFPDVPGYRTLKADLHMHTVFSDGSVWPNIRVQEALKDGLDIIAITEHLEYQPHAHDIPHPDRNRAHEIATGAAGEGGLIVLNGSEVTRSMPPGHSNAIFVRDANLLLQEDVEDVFRTAREQGAFVFWNHPDWRAQRPDGIARLDSLHRVLIDNDLMHGIEVVNDLTYSDEALQIALDHGLAIIGTSDVHGLIDWQYRVAAGGHRPVTLIFATDRSEAAIREALFAGRTVVWHNNLLIGRTEHLRPLLDASLEAAEAGYLGDTSILRVAIRNRSDVRFLLRNRSDYGLHRNADVVEIAPNGVTLLEVKPGSRVPRLSMDFEVLNALTAPATHPIITVTVGVESAVRE